MFPWHLAPLAFACEYVDSTLGMGYGTALTPILFLFGLVPAEVVPAVLLSELATDVAGVFLHHRAGNVNFRLGSQDLKIGFVIGIVSAAGAIAGVVASVSLPTQVVKTYIASLVLVMGGLMILQRKRGILPFSWRRLAGLLGVGSVASFNKGISGGGYGPLMMPSQIVSGVGPKNAVGITSLAEAFTCLVGVVSYLVLRPGTSWHVAPPLLLGAVLAVPCAVLTVRRLPQRSFTLAVAVAVVLLGSWSLFQALR